LTYKKKVPKKKDLRLRQIGDTCRLTALCQSIVPQGLFVPERAVHFEGIAPVPKRGETEFRQPRERLQFDGRGGAYPSLSRKSRRKDANARYFFGVGWDFCDFRRF